MTSWYFIRHAEKERGNFFNPHLRHQDGPISQKGRLEAQTLYPFFSAKPIAAIYVSAYQRTRQTIAYTAQQLRLDPIVDDRLNEIDNGCLDAMTDQEVQQKFPDVWKAVMDRSYDFRFPEGETGEEAQRRITAFLEEKRRQHSGENIILVAHDGLIRLLMCTILQLPVYHRWKFRADFCGITEISPQGDSDTWKVIRFNQTP